nr:N-formylglutamate deformylase [Candidatus Pantoea persica]
MAQGLAAVYAAQSDYSWVVNGRFKCGYITRAHGQPQEKIQAVQLELELELELAQRNYMDETPPFAWRQERASALQKVLKPMVQRFMADGKPA